MRKTFVLGLADVMVAAGLANGQTAPPKPPQVEQVKVALPPALAQVHAEDIEVMRRLLAKTIQETLSDQGGKASLVAAGEDTMYRIAGLNLTAPAAGTRGLNYLAGAALGNQQPFNSFMPPGVVGRARGNKSIEECQIEGTRLNGYGLVFDAQVPIHFIQIGNKEPATNLKPLSQWDMVRKEMHGETIPVDATASRPETQTLVDRVLKTLAENGHHLTKMLHPSDPPSARLSVIFTFRQTQRCDLCHIMQTGLGEAATWMNLFQSANTDQQNTQAFLEALGRSGVARSEQHNVNQSPGAALRGEKDTEDHVLLGDLHFKQGRYKEAAEAYRAALDKNQANNQGSPINKEFSLVEIAGKLAQAQNLSGDQKGALETLGKAQSFIRSLQRDAGEPPDPSMKSKSLTLEQLPSKLIITVTREDLEAFHKGSIDLERFKNTASVQVQMFLSKTPIPREKGAETITLPQTPPPSQDAAEPKP